MPVGITKDTKREATDYAKVMKEQGWDVAVGFDSATGKYKVYVSQRKEEEAKEYKAEEIPTTISEVIAQEEARTKTGKFEKYGRRPFKKGLKETSKELAIAADTGLSYPLSTKHAGQTLEHMKQKRRIDVVGGMKKAIPTVGGEKHGYFARIGEVKTPRIAQEPGIPRIAASSQAEIAGQGSGVTLGVPRSVRFSTAGGIRFSVPKVPKLKVGHELMPKEAEK